MHYTKVSLIEHVVFGAWLLQKKIVILLFSLFLVQIHQLLLPAFPGKEARQLCGDYLLIWLLTPRKEIQTQSFQMAQACDGHAQTCLILPSMDQVSY